MTIKNEEQWRLNNQPSSEDYDDGWRQQQGDEEQERNEAGE